MEYSCCIAGHRQVPRGWSAEIRRRLSAAVEDLLERGVYHFVQGLTSDFDVLSAQTLLQLKEKHPQLKLEIMMPCRDYQNRWSNSMRPACEEILSQCDETVYMFESLRRGDLHKYNSEMINRCRYCLCRLTRISGTTCEMVRYARKTGRVVINISEQYRLNAASDKQEP